MYCGAGVKLPTLNHGREMGAGEGWVGGGGEVDDLSGVY